MIDLAIGGFLAIACKSAGVVARTPTSASAVTREETRLAATGATTVLHEESDETNQLSGTVAEEKAHEGSPEQEQSAGEGYFSWRRYDQRLVELANQRHGLSCGKKSESYGCVDKHGNVVIPYIHVFPVWLSEAGLALVKERDAGWFYVDARYKLKLEALERENVPDEAFGRLARFRERGNIGYLDPQRGIVIAARYPSAHIFEDGKALVCLGCHPERWEKFAPREADCTGEAFMIDESGRRLAEKPDLWDCEEAWLKRPAGAF